MSASVCAPSLATASLWIDMPFEKALPHATASTKSLSILELDRSMEQDELEVSVPASLKHASRKRQLSFLGGRLCAAEALRELGSSSRQVNTGADGAPCWPAGFIGSITHTDDAAHVVVLSSGAIDAIGIDAEPLLDLEGARDVLAVCCTEAERSRYGAQDADFPQRMTMLFSAKEAYYKACRSRAGAFIDFADVELRGDLPQGTVVVRPVRTSPLANVLPNAQVWISQGVEAGRPCVHAAVFVGPIEVSK